MWKRLKNLWYLSGLDLNLENKESKTVQLLTSFFKPKAKILEPEVNLDELLK